MSGTKIVTTDGAPGAIGPYSQAVRSGDLLFLSGQVGLDPGTGTLVRGSVEEEAARVLENLGAVLRAAGADFQQVVKTTVYLTDMRDFEALNGIYARYFGDSRPARATVQVSGLPKGARVEIDAIARISVKA
jgi:2-iminobutanoate/2-iminopropanoate deaminase